MTHEARVLSMPTSSLCRGQRDEDVAHLVVNRFDGGREVAVESIVGRGSVHTDRDHALADLPFLRSHWRAARRPRRAVV
jgi:hypothetical protein